MTALAREPYKDEAEFGCTVCDKEELLVVITGGIDCGHCGNQIRLCIDCLDKLADEIIPIISTYHEADSTKH